jgi:hypothetical protein
MHVKAFLFMEQIEFWLPVVGYEGIYDISNLGRVKRLHAIRSRGRKTPDKIMKPRVDKDGYLKFTLQKNKKPKSFMLHRLIAFAFIPNIEKKPVINHKDGNKTNNSICNLEWCTVSENTKHAHNNGLAKVRFGENCNFSKLTEKNVIEIKNKIMLGLSNKVISTEYKVSDSSICMIKNGKRWKHIIL